MGQFEGKYECKVELIGYDKSLAKSARFLNRVITFTDQGVEFEADQRLVEALIEGLGIRDANTSPCPGSKPKPIPKSDHQVILEKRLAGEGGSDCIIANLKSQIGQLRAEL